jgi:hypothetical protein
VHALSAAAVDLLLQIDELATWWIEVGIAGAHAPHARGSVTVATRTRCAIGTVWLLP